MGTAWATCKFCGFKYETSYDPRFDRTNPATERVERHIWEKHRDKLPKYLRTLRQYRHWNACSLCTFTEPCPDFPGESDDEGETTKSDG